MAGTRFYPCDLLQEFKSIEIRATSLEDKILSPGQFFSLLHMVGFVPGASRCDVCPGFDVSCVLTVWRTEAF